jgi:hypothetical protein
MQEESMPCSSRRPVAALSLLLLAISLVLVTCNFPGVAH